MKKLIVLALFASAFGCAEEPAPRYVDAGYRRPAKTAPSVSSKAEEFRAVEKPASYSE